MTNCIASSFTVYRGKGICACHLQCTVPKINGNEFPSHLIKAKKSYKVITRLKEVVNPYTGSGTYSLQGI